MPVCGSCGKSWPKDTKVCPGDGTALSPAPGNENPSSQFAPTVPTGIPRVSSASGSVPVIKTDPPMISLSPPKPSGQSGAAPEPVPTSRELEAGMMVGEYKIEQQIGEGGMAVVYSAIHPLIGKKAAIKVISHSLSTDAEAIKRFRQ